MAPWFSKSHRHQKMMGMWAAISGLSIGCASKQRGGQGCGYQFNKPSTEFCAECHENWNFSPRGQGTTTPRSNPGFSSAPWSSFAAAPSNKPAGTTPFAPVNQTPKPGLVHSRQVHWKTEVEWSDAAEVDGFDKLADVVDEKPDMKQLRYA